MEKNNKILECCGHSLKKIHECIHNNKTLIWFQCSFCGNLKFVKKDCLKNKKELQTY